MARRLRLEPGEATPWHTDPFNRVTVVISGDALVIEYRRGEAVDVLPLRPGQVDWDEPNGRVHRAVNTGSTSYEEVSVFLLDRPDADPQPRA